MRSSLLVGLFAILMLGSSIYPAIGQTNSIADHVVINELDTNPIGNDADSILEWVELYNPTDTSVDIGGWSIASTTLLKKSLTIPTGTVIKPGEYLVFNHVSLWFPDILEIVELRDKTGNVIDKTPEITDLKNDYTSWQRIWDGVDNDSYSDWEFSFYSIGSSNGKLEAIQEEEGVSVTVETNKENYIFGETMTISGHVSERIYVEKPYFTPAKINIKIFGPDGYQKNIDMYPDRFLNFKNQLTLNQVLGITEGTYTVSVEYAGSNVVSTFSVGDKVILTEEKEQGVLSVFTDKDSYLPGESVKLTALSNGIIPLEGLKFKVINADRISIFSGNLFPNTKGEFNTSVFITTVNPVYGEYKIVTDYSTQHAETTFTVLEDVKEAKLLSLNVEKPAYGLNDIVVITGRLNTGWVPHFDLEILQTSTSSDFGGSGSLNQYAEDTTRFLDQVNVLGDSSFRYEYRILNNENSYGEYKVTVSNDAARGQAFFAVRENPDEFIASSDKLTINTSKESYNIKDELVVTGYVGDVKTRTSFEIPAVEMIIVNEQGKKVKFLGCPQAKAGGGNNQELCDIPTVLTLTGVPNLSGSFKTTIPLSLKLFEPGKYTIKGDYDNGKLMASKSFVINEQESIDISNIVATIDKEVYGLNEVVTLNGKVSTDFPQISLAITLTKPDGSTKRDTVLINSKDSTFSWNWKTPASETIFTQLDNQRSIKLSNFGVYQIRIESESEQTRILFAVSETPAEPTRFFDTPIRVETDKSVYNAGEKLTISGITEKREQINSSLIPERVRIQVKDSFSKNIYESFLHPGVSGQFKTTYDLPITLFSEGTYRVVVTYFELRDEVSFVVTNEFKTGTADEVAILMSLDKEEYYPGDTVTVKGKTNRIIFLEHFEIRVIRDDPNRINCGSFYCGHITPPTLVVPDKLGAFTFQYKIPNSNSIGKYEISADTDFGSTSVTFLVVEKPEEVEKKIVTEGEKSTKKIIDKFNRIPDISIPITVGEKTVDDDDVSPRVIRGSLFTSVRGDEANVNIQVTSESGICVIGVADDCLVKDSTRSPGAIYKTVEVDGVSYNIRYSGPDVRLEKFDIVPESPDVLIPDSTWNIDVIKDDQPTRFYYKVSYVPVE